MDAIASLPTLSFLHMYGCQQLTDEVAEELARGLIRYDSLRHIGFAYCSNTTSRSAAAFQSFTRLESFGFAGGNFKGLGDVISKYASLWKLQGFGADYCDFLGSEFDCLAETKGISRIQFYGLKEADTGMAILKNGGIRLRVLTIPESDLTDAGLANLPETISNMSLEKTRITDAGIRMWAAQQPSMVHLTLAHTAISDVGLSELRQLKRLDYLNVTRTRVTPGGIAALKQIFPNCTIDSDHAVPAAPPATP
jgi:hypothetical protein